MDLSMMLGPLLGATGGGGGVGATGLLGLLGAGGDMGAAVSGGAFGMAPALLSQLLAGEGIEEGSAAAATAEPFVASNDDTENLGDILGGSANNMASGFVEGGPDWMENISSVFGDMGPEDFMQFMSMFQSQGSAPVAMAPMAAPTRSAPFQTSSTYRQPL